MTRTLSRHEPNTLRRNTFTVLLALVFAVAVWWVSTHLLHIDLAVRSGDRFQNVGLASVLAVSLGSGLVGWLVAALLCRLAPHRASIAWPVVATVVLLLSLLGPVGGATPAAVTTLALLHVLVGVTLVVGLRPGRGGYGE